MTFKFLFGCNHGVGVRDQGFQYPAWMFVEEIEYRLVGPLDGCRDWNWPM